MRFAYHHALSPDTVPAAKKRSLEPVNDDIRTLLRIGITNNDQYRSLVSQLPYVVNNMFAASFSKKLDEETTTSSESTTITVN